MSVALARYLRAFVLSTSGVAHPSFDSEVLRHMEPVILRVDDTHYNIREELLQPPFPRAGDPQAFKALGLLLRGIAGSTYLTTHTSSTRDVLAACLRQLDTAGEAVDAAPAELAAAAGGSGPALPTAAELRLACLIRLVQRGPESDHGTPLAEFCKAAERLLQLQPDEPLAWARAAAADHHRGRRNSAIRLHRRAYEAACTQRDDMHIAAAGYQMAIDTARWRKLAMAGTVVEGGYPRPSQLLAALRAADAAHARCRRLMPTLWHSTLNTCIGLQRTWNSRCS